MDTTIRSEWKSGMFNIVKEIIMKMDVEQLATILELDIRERQKTIAFLVGMKDRC